MLLKYLQKSCTSHTYLPPPPPGCAQSDLERTLHLDICPAEGSEPPAADPLLSDPAAARSRDNPAVYECRRCEIQFQDSRLVTGGGRLWVRVCFSFFIN